MHSSQQQSSKIDYSGSSLEVIRCRMERESSKFKIDLHHSEINSILSKKSIYNNQNISIGVDR
jgi:hypothetical protein